LACVYPNVYLDLGEVFPMVSRDAQESILRQSLELTPANRLLWSTDGHFHPETFWLANRQFRQALETASAIPPQKLCSAAYFDQFLGIGGLCPQWRL
jgi:predicted TIM-barrel fold metal-dependent hydrolase